MVAFGTSGLRGLATDLLAGTGYRYALAFAEYLVSTGQALEGSSVLVGCDRRQSSPALTRQVMAALTSIGLDPVYCGILPTPALAYHALNTGSAAVMVTGSHIPPDRNGLKFYRPDGEIDKADEAAIAAAVAMLGDAEPVENGGDLPEPDREPLDRYVSRYKSAFPSGMLAGKRVGVYQHSSVARDILATLAESFGADVLRLGDSDEFVAIDTEAVEPETAARLERWAAEHHLDMIVSTDGDADRPLMTDEKGLVIRGDALGVLVSRFLKADMVVTPVSSNPGIDGRYGFQVRRTRIGSPFVLQAMAQAAADGFRRIVGFEANGGVLVGTPVETGRTTLAPLPTRDAVLPILCAMADATRLGLPLSRIIYDLALPIYVSGRLENFARVESDRLMTWLRASPENVQNFFVGIGLPTRVDETDGLQVFFENDTMMHLRPSGNAPEMRCYVSAETAGATEALLAEGLFRVGRFAKGVGANS